MSCCVLVLLILTDGLSMCRSKLEAIQTQFVTAIAAFAGTAVGLLFHLHPLAESLILAFTAGGFLYIATCSMLAKVLSSSRAASLSQVSYELVALLLGIMFMVGVLALEGDDHHH